MLERILFKRSYRCFDVGDVVEFRAGLNLLVGDQGVGKSTILELIRNLVNEDASKAPGEVVEFEATANMRLRAWDFELDNPRVQDQGWADSLSRFLVRLDTSKRSHGQAVNSILGSLGAAAHDRLERTFYALDEPDSGLSPRSALRLLRTLQALVEEGHQVLASVHNPLVIGGVPEVLSLEHRVWMRSEVFLETQHRPPVERRR